MPNRKKRKRRCKYTVLWVDDEAKVSAAVARNLLRHSIRVIPAADGMQGYWLALTRRPDAIVTDLKMPRWRGDEFVRCLHQNEATRGIPTVILSGYADELDDDFSEKYGIEAVLEKPLCFDTLLTALRRCLPKQSSAKASVG